MLAKRRGFYRDGKEIIRTPLLLPSFSSKGFPEIGRIIRDTSERIASPCLISAYDLYHGTIEGPFSFAEALFVDSGGYEASKDVELSDLGIRPHEPLPWDEAKFKHIIGRLDSSIPTVIISYDHPKERFSTEDQIARADAMIPKNSGCFREILFKPERPPIDRAYDLGAKDRVNVDAIIANIHEMRRFDAMGVTEKEIGRTLKERTTNISRIRRALNRGGMDSTPIHIFGSLDTMATPLYYVAGADVFDGLTWLRFSYYQGMTVYRQNYSTFVDPEMDWEILELKCSWDNLAYLKDLELELRGYPTKGVSSFRHHRELINGMAESLKNEERT